jgi:uncharacterized Zn finger protein
MSLLQCPKCNDNLNVDEEFYKSYDLNSNVRHIIYSCLLCGYTDDEIHEEPDDAA